VSSSPISRAAIASAILAFGLWGLLPIYWKALGQLGSDVAIAQRVVWTMVVVIPLLWFRSEVRVWLAAFRNPGILKTHLLSGGLLAVNWTVFVWAAQHGHIVDASLGYFINPLFNVLIGRLWLGERLSPLQAWSIGFATLGVLAQIVLVGRVPWIGLLLAVSFAAYGWVRRHSSLGSLTGLGMETLLWLPLAIVWLGRASFQNVAIWGDSSVRDLALIAGLGIVTAAPLLGFAHAARNLPFSVLGVLQFLAPTGQFLLGALFYLEPLSPGRWVSFGFIWIGVIAFCLELIWRSRSTP
tara:strand:- start:157 stop:1047 length:891 start_codon:yes stop_codon:yes gene_type:complete